jgi:hypothetical protein
MGATRWVGCNLARGSCSGKDHIVCCKALLCVPATRNSPSLEDATKLTLQDGDISDLLYSPSCLADAAQITVSVCLAYTYIGPSNLYFYSTALV